MIRDVPSIKLCQLYAKMKSQLWAKMGLSFKQYHKAEREIGQLWPKNESQLLKWAWVLNNTIKAKQK
jgi:hypothetical protein